MKRIFRLINQTVKRNCLMEIQGLPLGQYEIVIKEVTRNNQQNALYWKWAEIIGSTLGYSAEDMHDAFKRHFLGEDEKINVFGQVVVNPKSSASLKKREFSDYMNKVEAFASSQGITLPSPDYYGYETTNRTGLTIPEPPENHITQTQKAV